MGSKLVQTITRWAVIGSRTDSSAVIGRPLLASIGAGLGADEAPAVELAAGQPVGDAERLQHRGQRHQREAGQEQDGDVERHGTIRQVCGRNDQ